MGEQISPEQERVDSYIKEYGEYAELSPGEVLKIIEIKSPTMLRYYADECREYLRFTHTSGGHRRYYAGDLPVILRIKQICQDEGHSLADARTILRAEGYSSDMPIIEDSEPEPTSELADFGTGAMSQFYEALMEEIGRGLKDSEKRIKVQVREQQRAGREADEKEHEEIMKQIEIMTRSNQELQETNKRLLEQVAALNSEIEKVKEQTTPKKPWWRKK